MNHDIGNAISAPNGPGVEKLRVSQAQRLHQEIRSDILTVRLRPGEVVIEAELSHRYGVSKTPVREALQMLVVEGLVTVLPRRGYMIRSLGFQDVRDIMQLRLFLEPQLAATAARHSTPALVQQLRGFLHQQFDETETMEVKIAAPRSFHLSLAAATNNPRAVRLLEGLLDETNRMHLLFSQAMNHMLSEEEHDAHQRIIEAIESGNDVRAEMEMREHLEESNSALLKAAVELR